MKRLIPIATAVMIAVSADAQRLFGPLQEFAETCVNEKTAIRVERPDYDIQYIELYKCLKAWTTIPLKNAKNSFHPSVSYADSDFRGHIVFSAEYISDYMQGKIPDPYTRTFPNDVQIDESFRKLDREVRSGMQPRTDSTIYFVNSLVSAAVPVEFSFRISSGEQQIVVLSENETPLLVEVSSNSGTHSLTVDGKTDFAKLIWQESTEYARLVIKVSTRAEQPTSFVLAFH